MILPFASEGEYKRIGLKVILDLDALMSTPYQSLIRTLLSQTS